MCICMCIWGVGGRGVGYVGICDAASGEGFGYVGISDAAAGSQLLHHLYL